MEKIYNIRRGVCFSLNELFRQRTIIILVILLAGSMEVAAAGNINKLFADIIVRGTVTDAANGESLPGVTVKIKGSATGVATDLQGRFSITVPEDAVLEISYLGYARREVAVNKRTQINITLESTSSALEEFVVVGYGTIAKTDYNGSSSTIQLQNVNENKVISVPEALQGKLAGVQIQNNTGEPGAGMTFNIRGLTSITGSNQPLVVVDGQPIESSLGSTQAGSNLDGGAVIPPADPLASINPSDIASIEVLKDASSTAIYGSRGANGVILITTKSGKSGRDKLTYTTRLDMSQLPKKLDVLSSRQYMDFRNEAALNDGLTAPFTAFQLDSVEKTQGIIWQDLIYRNAFSQDHQLSVSGRDDKSNYYITGNFSDQNSIIRNAGFKRGGLRVNYEKKVSPKLTVGIRNYFSLADRNFGQQSNKEGIFGSSAVGGALSFNPLNSPYLEDGTIDETFANNPITVITKVLDKTQIRTLTSNLNVDYKITKNLAYKLTAGVNDLYSKRQLYYPTGTFIGNTAPNGSATQADNSNSNYVIDNILNYRKVFGGKHSLNVVGGYSYQAWKNTSTSITNLDFPSNSLTYFNFASATALGRTYNTDKRRALASVISRLNYAYDRRYSLTLTARYDGATRLAEGNKWQLFPSVGLGWNVSNEKFFKDNVKFLSTLKLRTSFGIAGNENVAIGATQATYSINNGVVGPTITPGYIIDNFANPDLKWEITKQYNVGADFGFAEDRVSVSVDVYKKKTSDLLISLPIPASSGFVNYNTNVGNVTNKGIDVEGTFSILRGAVKWDAGANFSVFDNNVVDIGPSSIIFGTGYISAGAIVLGQPIQVAKPGFPISSFWGYKTQGIYQNQTEINTDPGLAVDNTRSTIKPGDIKYADINNDGQINELDKTVIGNPSADFTYGFNSNLSYKRFSFSMSIFGSQGAEIINLNRWITGANNTNGNFNSFQDAYDGRWRGEGTSNKYPRLTTAAIRMRQRFPDLFVEDASFIRLQNATVGYTFKLPAGLKLGNLKTYITGTNLITLTPYSGYDPNINAFGNRVLMSGTDFGTLPQARTFSAGLELTF
ncbi:TonB-dependent receptor [Daejeonella sp.]|uniref:SusC/RagA family TonB-linked outer membrane protein n=1 Tax=Daejeonella sp. TaxID=2805397 RepID=UPI0030BD0EE0